MLLVFLPEAFVPGSFKVAVDPVPVGLVVGPLALVHVAVGMDEPALAVGLVVLPLALVHAAVWPDQAAFPASDSSILDPKPGIVS